MKYCWEHLARAMYYLKQTTYTDSTERDPQDVDECHIKAQKRILRRYETYCPHIKDVLWTTDPSAKCHVAEGDYIIFKSPKAQCECGGDQPGGVGKVRALEDNDADTTVHVDMLTGYNKGSWCGKHWEIIHVVIDEEEDSG